VRLLILERLRKQPSPQTIAKSDSLRSVVSSSTARTPPIAVFNVPELLESILSYLPMKDLFIARSVNKAFYSLIATSPTLQRNLFLLPETSQPQYWQTIQSKVNHHIYAVIASPSDAITFPSPQYIGSPPAIVTSMNPLLQNPDSPRVAARLLYENCRDSAEMTDHMLQSRPWTHMYVTNPPCTCAHIQVEYVDEWSLIDPAVKVRRNVYDPTGVTFGAIYEAFHKRGVVAVDKGQGDILLSDTTAREQVAMLEREDPRASLDAYSAEILFCHHALPSDAEFEEMRRNGRVKGGFSDPEE